MRAADHLVQTLTQLGVQNIFSLSGNQIMPIYDACIDSDLRLIHTHHEAGAVHMADAWGRLTNTPGVALIAGGPGFANGLSAMYVAKMAESPMVVLSGHVAQSQIGRGAFQEMKQVEMAREVTKASWLLEDSAQIGSLLRHAFDVAKHGRPGPVHVSLPFDLLSTKVTSEREISHELPKLLTLKTGQISTIVAALRNAKRPLLLAGSAVMHSNQFKQAQKLFEQINLPLTGTESPRGVNDPSLGDFASILAQADCLILIGKRLDFTLQFGQPPFLQDGAKLIQIDADQDLLEMAQRNADSLDIISLVQADPAEALTQLGAAVASLKFDSAWATEVAEAISFVPPNWANMRSTQGEPMHAVEVGRTIHNYLAGGENSIFVSDGGEFCQWMQATIYPDHRVINGLSGSLGCSVSFGVAASLAFPNSRIVVCVGDGAFGFQPFELETAVRNNLPFTTVIGHDARWNSEHQIQLRNYGPERTYAVELNETPYHKVMQALGGWGECVTDVSALESALIAAGESQLPACIDAMIQGEAAPFIRMRKTPALN